VGRGPPQLYDFDEAAGPLSLNIWLHRHARRAAGYRVNTVKRFVRPIHLTISGIKPRDKLHGRPTARHAHQPSVAFEFTNVSSFVKIVNSSGSLAPPSFSLYRTLISITNAVVLFAELLILLPPPCLRNYFGLPYWR
jgi:hypothetical protein